MGSLSQLLYTARDSLTAQSYGLSVTGQNITNVNTPGYVKRDPLLESHALGTSTPARHRDWPASRHRHLHREARADRTRLGGRHVEQDRQLASVEACSTTWAPPAWAALDGLFSSFSALAQTQRPHRARRRARRCRRIGGSRQWHRGSLADAKNDLLQQAKRPRPRSQARPKHRAVEPAHRPSRESGRRRRDLKDQRNNLLLGLSELVDIRAIQTTTAASSSRRPAHLVEGPTREPSRSICTRTVRSS